MKRKVNGKKKVAGSIGLLTAAVCCFGVAATTNIPNSDLYKDGVVRVYADANVNAIAFADAVGKLRTAAEGLSDAEVRTNITVAEWAWTAEVQHGYVVAEGAEAELVPTDVETYEKYAEIFADLFLVAKNVDAAVNNINNHSLIVYASEASAYDNYFAYLTNGELSLEEIAIINGVGTGNRDTTKKDAVNNYFNGKIEAEQNAKTAVDAVKKVADAIVLTSIDSIKEAEDAVKAVYGDVKDVDGNVILDKNKAADIIAFWETLEGYRADYNALVKENEDVAKAIKDVWALYNNGEKCLSIETEIVNAETLYAALDDSVDNNQKAAVDAETAVEQSTMLVELRDELDARRDAVIAVELLINDIENPVVYDNTKILDAREAYDALPAEITSLKEIADIAEYVSNYSVLVDAEEAYDALVDAVDEIKTNIASLATKYNDGSLTATFMTDIKMAKNALTYQAQKDAIDNDEIREGVTYQAELETYQTQYEEAVAAAAKVIKAIKDIATPVTIDSATSIIEAEKFYAELTETQQRYVTNYADLTAARAELDQITADVNAWKDLVLALPEAADVTILDKAQIEACVEAYENYNFSAEMLAYIEANETKTKEKYDDVKDALKAITDKIANVSDAYLVDAIVNVGENPDDNAVVAFSNAYETAKGLFDALSDDEKAFFISNYSEADVARLVAETKYEIYGVEAKIANLPEAEALVLADNEKVVVAKDAFDALGTDKQAQVRATYSEKLAACVAKMAEITGELDQWMLDAKALVGVDKDGNDVADFDLAHVDVDAILNYHNQFEAFNDDEKEFVKAAHDILVLKEEIILAAIDALNDRIDDMEAKIGDSTYALTANDRDELDSIKAAYDNLHETQAKLVNYSDINEAYNKINVVDYVEAAINALLADVKAENLTTEGYVTYNVINAVYFNLSDEIKELITNASELAVIGEAYKANEADILDVKTLADELQKAIDSIDNVDTKLSDVKTFLEKAINENANKISDLDKALSDKVNYILEDKVSWTDLDKKLNALNELINNNTKAIEQAKTELTEAYETAIEDAKTVLRGEIAVIEKALQDVDAANKTELLGKIATLQAELDAYKLVVEGLFDGVNTDIDALEKALADAKTELTEAYETAIEAAKTELNKTISDLETALKAADVANKEALEEALAEAKEALEAADAANLEAVNAKIAELEEALNNAVADLEKADAALKNEIDELRKSLTTVTVILSIVSGLALAGAVALFVLKYRKKN